MKCQTHLAFIGFLLIILSSCSSHRHVEYSEPAAKVRITDRLPPRGICQFKGTVYSSAEETGDKLEQIVRESRMRLKERAVEISGNYVRIETNNTTTYKSNTIVAMSGAVYHCKLPRGKDEVTPEMIESTEQRDVR